MYIFVSFLLLVEGNIFLYESVIFQSLETICSYPWYIFLLACSTFLMGWGTLFRYAVGETKDSQVLQYIKNHLEGLLKASLLSPPGRPQSFRFSRFPILFNGL